MNRREAEQRGRRAETIAAWWLRLHGWRILAQRVKMRGGELDLVARRGKVVAFIEVKQRATADAAAFALDEYRLRRVAVAARQLSARYVGPRDDMRIDAVFIVPRRLPVHLANVWLG
ncbi:MAG: YraN family protein [Sphingomicrobium sp.]